MPDPTRKRAFASVKVFAPSHGDPICVDRGLGWYSILAKDAGAGTSTVDALGRAYLQAFEEVGLIHRAFLVAQDTRLSQWTTSGGLWEEERFSTGGGRAYRITQYDLRNTVTSWSATSTYHRPKDAPVAFSLVLPDTPSDWDFATYPPFIRVEVSPEWGVQFTKDGVFLMRYVSGVWRAVLDLPSPEPGGYVDSEEIWLFARVDAGQLGISFDFGRSYIWYAPPGETVSLIASKLVIRGRGGSITFGVHQLKLFTATFDSFVKELERARLASTVSFTGSRYQGPLGTGGSVAFSDQGSPLARQAAYRLTMTPGTQTGTPFTWYFGGSVQVVHYRIPPVVQATGIDSSTPFDASLISARITKPYDLAGGNATFSFTVDAFTPSDFEGYRWRRMEVWLGWRLSDGSLETYAAFVGYAEVVSATWSEQLGKALVTFQLHNGSARFKRSPWTPFLQLPLGGLTPNAIGDVILDAHGLNSSYRSWFTWGATGVVAPGAADNPNELTAPQELPWETLTRVFSERFLEVGVDDTGVLFTLPKDYVAGSVSRTFTAGEVDASVWDTLKAAEYAIDFKESATTAMVYGNNEFGQLVFRCDVDTVAETDTTNSRFCPWTEVRLQELPGTPDAGLVTGHCQSLARDAFPIKREGSVSLPVDPTVGRRDRVALNGFAGIGLPDGSEFMVADLAHEWDTRKGYLGLETTVGIRRLS